MLKTILLPAMSLALMFGPANVDQATTAVSATGEGGSYNAADWGVTKLQVGTRKKTKRSKRVRRSKPVSHSSTLRRQNFAAPGGFSLRRGGFNDDHTPGNGQ